MVKDLGTGVEKGNAQSVLDGDLDDFLEAALAQNVAGAEPRQLTEQPPASSGRGEVKRV